MLVYLLIYQLTYLIVRGENMRMTVRSDGFEGYTKRALAKAKRLAGNEKIEP